MTSKKLDRRTVLKGAAAGASLLALGCATTGGGGTSAAPALAQRTGKAATPKKLLILGGTAFLGPELVASAQARGHTVTLFNRGKTHPELFPDLEKLRGDRDSGDLKALEGRKWDAVIDTSGYVPREVKQSAELLAPNVGQYVFISTVSVYGDRAAPGMDETSAVETMPDETNEEVRKYYGALKALCEKAAEKAMPGRVANIRPGLIVGPGDPTDRFSYWPVRVARGGEVLAPGDGTDRVQVVDVRDLAEWTIQVIEDGQHGIYNALGPDQGLPIKTLLDDCKAAVGGDARFTWVPTKFLEEQKVEAWSDMPTWIPAEGAMAGIGRTSNARAMKTGLRFRPIVDTARDTLAWFKTLPPERQAKLRAGLTAEREQAVLAAWKANAAGKK